MACAVAGALALHTLVTLLLSRLRGRPRAVAAILRRHVATSSRVLVAVVAVAITLPALDLGPDADDRARHGVVLAIIATVGWLAIGLLGAAIDVLLARIDTSTADNLRARRVVTQATIARGIAAVVIGFVTVVAMLMTFGQVRTFGAGLLASAGVIGIVVGVAAQATLSNLLAGIQIALTEPIRLDDVVVVEGEWGRIEEITFTYVVVVSWDERRVVLPISYFTQTPFQNWTRHRAQVIGEVRLHVDHATPLDPLRAELERVTTGSDLWDGRVVTLQAVEHHPESLEVRALVSAADAPRAFDLRCLVREHLLAFLAREHPEALPRLRGEVARVDGSARLYDDDVPARRV